MLITNKNQFVNYLLLIGAIVIVLNIVSRNLFFRWDITDNRMYSLSESSREVIGKLQDRLMAKVYFSGDLPGNYANSRRYLQDLLEEYQAYSDGRFQFEFINPDHDEKAQQQARNYNIPPVQLQAIENDKMEIKNVFMGLVLQYNDKKETIPVIQTTQGLEYNLTSSIKKISSAKLKHIGIISPENEDITTQNLSRFLQQIYNLRAVSLASDIPEDISTILMNGVTDSVKTEELYRLDQFLMRGGKLFLAQGAARDFLQQGFAMDIKSNVYKFLENAGVKIAKELIIDQKCSQVQMQSQQGFFTVRTAVDYPLLPLIQKFNKESILTQKMTQARVFFVSEISPIGNAAIQFTPLMYTSDRTGSLQGPFYQIQPNQNPMMRMFPFPSKAIAALVEGTVSSFFKDSVHFATRPNFIPVTTSAQMIVITDNQFFNDKRAGGLQENTDFILNGVDYLTGDKELIQIRSRDILLRPLGELSDASRRTWKWLNVFLPAVLVILLGLYTWKRNRDKRKMIEEIYA
jgi:gliding-associated putative ABC transporter substrate-binding component GldG